MKIIGKYAFQNTSLECIAIPPHVTEIGDFAFVKCPYLQIIYIEEYSELLVINGNIFDYNSEGIVMIPCGSNIKFV